MNQECRIRELEDEIKRLKCRIRKLECQRPIYIPYHDPCDPCYPIIRYNYYADKTEPYKTTVTCSTE